MSLIVVATFALLISISAATSAARVEAKPLSQNHIKFRRLPPKEFSAALGSSITIECEAGGSPPPAIHWLKNGKPISNYNKHLTGAQQSGAGPGGGGQSQHKSSWASLVDSLAPVVDEVNRIALSSTRSRLFIDCANFQDEAVYTCIAENAFARISSHTKLDLIKPLAPAPTSGDNELISSALEEAAALDLAAQAAASGPEAAAASAGGQTNPGQVNKQLVSELESAVAAAAKQQAAAQGLSAIPRCLSERAKTEPARIHMWTHNIVEVMRNSVLLYCRSNVKALQIRAQRVAEILAEPQTGNEQQSDSAGVNSVLNSAVESDPAASAQEGQQQQQQLQTPTQLGPTVTWTLPDDKQVDATYAGKYEVLDTGDLLIRDLRWADMGSYVCTVADDQGSDSISTFVYPTAVKMNNKRSTLNRHQMISARFR